MFFFKRRKLSPVWIFALVYLGCSLFVSLLRFSSFLLTLGIACGAAAALAATQKDKLRREEKSPAAEASVPAAAREQGPGAKEEDLARYSPGVQSVIRDGKLALSEMERLHAAIRDPSVRERIDRITAVSGKIIEDARSDESDVPQIRRFLDFYIPTTLKLLNAYDRMDATGLDGENISHSKKSIEEMLDTTIAAYEKQLDALFSNQAMDIDAEIRSMKSLLEREGLGEKNPLDWNSFKAEYDQNKQQKEKGLEQNG